MAEQGFPGVTPASLLGYVVRSFGLNESERKAPLGLLVLIQ